MYAITEYKNIIRTLKTIGNSFIEYTNQDALSEEEIETFDLLNKDVENLIKNLNEIVNEYNGRMDFIRKRQESMKFEEEKLKYEDYTRDDLIEMLIKKNENI